MKQCCNLHKEGKYKKWPCSDGYNAKERSERFQNEKKKCIDCPELCSRSVDRCKKCAAKILGESKVGKKLPEWWRKRISDGQRMEKHWAWKGDQASYSAIHKWLYRNKVKDEKCLFCEETKNLQWANKSGLYKRTDDDWITLCVRCHKEYDNDTEKRFEWTGKTMVTK